MTISVLIAKSDLSYISDIKNSLLTEDYHVDTVRTGQECQLKVYQEKFDIVILDLDLQNHSGLKVLAYLRLNNPRIKVILLISSKERLKDLELSKDELKKLGASDIIIAPYSASSILQSIKGVNQFAAWKELKKPLPTNSEEQTINKNDKDFSKMLIENFYSQNLNIFDCYIRIDKNRYLKFLHRGEQFTPERLEKYKDKKYLYFKTKDRGTYINFINHVLTKTEHKAPKKLDISKGLVETYIQEIYFTGLSPDLIDEGQKICQNIFHMIQQDADLLKHMHQFEESNNLSYTHLFNTSLMSAIISEQLEWSSPRTTQIVTFGALVHDIGMLKLPVHLQSLHPHSIPQAQIDEYKQHPYYGVQMLEATSLKSEAVKQIVYQHHENINGEGFPNALTGIRIYPLAKIVATASEFMSLVSCQKNEPIQVLRDFVTNKKNIIRHDPIIVKALIQSFIRNPKEF